MQRQKCIPLVVHATTDGQDAKKNDEHFRSLLRLLTEKNVVRTTHPACPYEGGRAQVS
ncbi:hypothetical protein BD414DRAFT_502534, partial [Trametes punicea]